MAAADVVDVRLIDPTVKELAATLKKAHAAANRGVTIARSEKLDRDPDFWGRFARDCMREPAGRRRSCRAGYQTPEVIAGWWTDPAGRRHFRVLGRTRWRYHGRIRGEGELRGLPAWWQVYPESVLAVRRPADPEPGTYLACCRCGKVGTPESLGWMGDTCGPCFDRRADGGTAASGYGHFSGWQGYQPYVGFSHDGTRLVGPHLSNKIRTVDRSDGSAVMSRAMVGTLSAIAGTPDGFVLGLANGSVVRWDGAGGLHRILGSPQMYGRPALSPDGRRMVVLTQNAGFTADLAAGRPVYERVDGARTYAAVRFSNDGRRLFALTTQGELVSLAPDTLAPTVLRANVSDGIPRFGYMHDLVVSPDGSTLAVIRETNYPAGLTVRVIPLEENRPAFDLPLPGWHRPNAAAFSPDGSHLVTADPQAGWVGFWRLPSGKALGFARAVPEDPSWRSGQIVFSPDGRAVAVLYSGFHQERGSTVVVWPWPDVVTAASG